MNYQSSNSKETLCSILVKCLEQLTKATGETGYRSRDPKHEKRTLYRLSYWGMLKTMAKSLNYKLTSEVPVEHETLKSGRDATGRRRTDDA